MEVRRFERASLDVSYQVYHVRIKRFPDKVPNCILRSSSVHPPFILHSSSTLPPLFLDYCMPLMYHSETAGPEWEICLISGYRTENDILFRTIAPLLQIRA